MAKILELSKVAAVFFIPLGHSAILGEEAALNPLLKDQAPGTWLQLPAPAGQKPQRIHAHAGLAIDPRSSILYCFGSDTHNDYWNNDVWSFDAVSMTWKQHYAEDGRAAYRYQDGYRSTTTGRPWAMHVFGMCAWDPENRELVVGSRVLHYGLEKLPQVSIPKNAGDAWWRFNPEAGRWTPAPESPYLDLGALCYYPPWKSVLGFHAGSHEKMAEYIPATSKFRRFTTLRGEPEKNRLPKGYTLKTVFDEKRDRILLVSWDPQSNLWVLDPKKSRWEDLQAGNCPPGNIYGSYALDAGNDLLVALYPDDPKGGFQNPSKKGRTWICRLEANRWEEARLDLQPPYRGMSYQMAYDPRHQAVLYVDQNIIWSFKPKPQ